MKRLAVVFSMLFLVAALMAQTGDKRIALVIGNANYLNGGTLRNPANDADLMETTLKKLNFRVIKCTDADKAKMDEKIIEFSGLLSSYKIALFYYAGHGMQIDGVNYLIPTDAKNTSVMAVKMKSIKVSDIVEEMEKYTTNVNLVILDACRNNPFISESRGGVRGFKALSASGTLIAFAASEGETAADGEGQNGLYTEKLAAQLEKAQRIEDVFINTRIEVAKVSKNQQEPQEWSKLNVTNFYLKTQPKTITTTTTTESEEPEDIKIVKKKAKGSVQITTEIAGTLYIDDTESGKIAQGDVLDFQLTIGAHTLEIRGDENWTQAIKVEQSNPLELTVKTTKKKASTNTTTSTTTTNNKAKDQPFFCNMVYVEGSTFTMGDTWGDGGQTDEKPTHQVTLSSYYIGKYEITQRQYNEIMGSNPSRFSGCDECPVENVNWYDAQEFISKLNARTGQTYRLPTEAEWEFAARGGKKSNGTKWAGSSNIFDVGWNTDNSSSKTHSVGGKKPNELGIYDLTGNVWEWCQDWYGTYSSGSQTNPQGATSGSDRVNRGGSWGINVAFCRVCARGSNTPAYRITDLGFRLVSVP